MYVTLVEIQIKADKLDEFLEAFRPNHEGSIKEAGNRRFDVLQDPTDPTKFLIYEAYASEEDSKLHKTTEHYKACKAALEDLMTGPRSHRVFKGIMPAG